MNSFQSTPDLCESLLTQWRKKLDINNLESTQFSGELKALDRQLIRLSKRHLRLAVFGRVGVGKSSLLNALAGEEFFPTDVAHGCTRRMKSIIWNQQIRNLQTIELVDTPGIDEIAAVGRSRLAARVALNTDLIILVVDSDINVIELDAIETLLQSGKPLLLALNRCDQWRHNEIKEVVRSIRRRLPTPAKDLIIEVVAAAPRKAKLQENGLVRSEACTPQVSSLHKTLTGLLEEQGDLLLVLNALRQAENFYNSLKSGRLKRRRAAAQSLIGKFATMKASGVAINPFLIVDMATGIALDTALVVQLSNIYGLKLKGSSARKLIKRLSIQNTFLGGAQLGIQILLSAIRHLLLIGAPFTGGASLISTAPIALTQAAIAVQTTKITGRLAAREFLRGTQSSETQPSSIMRCIMRHDPGIRSCLNDLPITPSKEQLTIKALLP